jgi:hypothetical protein
MNKNVWPAIILLDEAKALFLVKPLYRTFRQLVTS